MFNNEPLLRAFDEVSGLGLATTSPFYPLAAIAEERLAALMTPGAIQTQWTDAVRQQRFADDLEMATIDTVTILVGPEHICHYNELLERFGQVVNNLSRSNHPRLSMSVIMPVTCMPPGQAWRRAPELVPVNRALGLISAQMTGAYPPGQAVLVPGELITAEIVDFLIRVQSAGGRLKGVSGDMAEANLWVACKDTLCSNSDRR